MGIDVEGIWRYNVEAQLTGVDKSGTGEVCTRPLPASVRMSSKWRQGGLERQTRYSVVLD